MRVYGCSLPSALRAAGGFDVDTTQGRGVFGDIFATWSHAGGTAFAANAVHLRCTPDGTCAGMNKVQRTVTLSADAASFTSTLAVQVLDTSGNLLSTVCPAGAAVRMNLKATPQGLRGSSSPRSSTPDAMALRTLNPTAARRCSGAMAARPDGAACGHQQPTGVNDGPHMS
jgi:hypothetical protein